MPTLLTRSPDNAEFARVLPVAALRRVADFEVDIAPSPEEAAAIAALLAADAVHGMRLAGSLRPEGEGWRLEARLTATVVQPCVVTLEPVATEIDTTVGRRFQPMADPDGGEVELDAEADEELEPLGTRIDLGLVAIEALALAMPAYPRSPRAALPEGTAPEAAPTGRARPFAALAALRPRDGAE